MCQWFDSTPNHGSPRNLFSEFSLKDLEGIKIFLIFIKKWTAECFLVVVPHTHLEQFSSPRYKLEKCEIKHGRLNGLFSLSDLNQTKTTGLFGCFGLELKQRFVRLQGVLMIYPTI